MKKYLVPTLAMFAPFAALAAEMGDKMEGSSVADQLNELLPFVHWNEGHQVAAIVSVVLWLSFIYAVVHMVKHRKL